MELWFLVLGWLVGLFFFCFLQSNDFQGSLQQ